MTTAARSPLLLNLRYILREARDILVSMELTVVLLVFSMVLVFAGTLDQVNLGIWAVQEKYFRSFIIFTQVGGVTLPVFPGGYAIGGLLLVNLVAAHVFRFRFTWRKSGIFLTHLGLIVLLVGELLTGLWQEDFNMRLTEGQTKNYAESFRGHELVIIDATDPVFEDVVAVPEARLARKLPLQHAQLPFRVVTKTFYANSSLHVRGPHDPVPAAPASAAGGQFVASPLPITYRTDERNIPSAIVEVVGAEGQIGSFLVSAHLLEPQRFEYAGRTWRIGLRLRRIYQPFSLTLLKFSHDRYAGTEIPKNFSSRLQLTESSDGASREVLIYMNNPLRHGGLTFYQAGFENDDRTTILQVVRNPSWLIPYIACSLMTLGLCVQFTIHLVAFVRGRVAAPRAIDTPRAHGAKSPTLEVPALPRRPVHS